MTKHELSKTLTDLREGRGNNTTRQAQILGEFITLQTYAETALEALEACAEFLPDDDMDEFCPACKEWNPGLPANSHRDDCALVLALDGLRSYFQKGL